MAVGRMACGHRDCMPKVVMHECRLGVKRYRFCWWWVDPTLLEFAEFQVSSLTSNSHFFQDKKRRHHISSKWSCHLITHKVITQHKTALAPPYFTSSFSKNLSTSLKNPTSQGKTRPPLERSPNFSPALFNRATKIGNFKSQVRITNRRRFVPT